MLYFGDSFQTPQGKVCRVRTGFQERQLYLDYMSMYEPVVHLDMILIRDTV